MCEREEERFPFLVSQTTNVLRAAAVACRCVAGPLFSVRRRGGSWILVPEAWQAWYFVDPGPRGAAGVVLRGSRSQRCGSRNLVDPCPRSVAAVNPVNPVHPVNPVSPVNPVNPEDPENLVNPVYSVNPVDPVNPVNFENPVNRVSLVNQLSCSFS